MKDTIGLMQLPNTKTETIICCHLRHSIVFFANCIVWRPGCTTFSKNHVSDSMDHQALFHILSTFRYYKILLSTYAAKASGLLSKMEKFDIFLVRSLSVYNNYGY